jgi:hypothetical protein
MAIADLEKIVARVAWIIGAHNNVFDDTIADDRFIQEEIRRSVIETEAEVVRTLCESYHPMRSDFLGWSADLTNGETLPPHFGHVEAVRIRPYSGAGSYEVAESTSRSNIKSWRTNTANVFDAIAHDATGSSLAGYFNITSETITFTGHRAQVNVCSYDPDYDTPELQIDANFDGVLVAGTIPRLNKLGVPQALVASYGNMYANFLGLIKQGLSDMPSLPEAQISE